MFRRKTPAPSASGDHEPMRSRLPDLLAAQVAIFGNPPSLTVVDAGAHHGHTAVQYLEHFPNSRVIALEPEPENFAIAKAALAPFRERVDLLPFALAETDGSVALRLTSHSGAHSLLEVGDMRYYDAPVETLTPIEVRAVSLDSLSAEHRLDRLDILKMDIQGGEALALRGASGLLRRGAIRVIYTEVLFAPLYDGQAHFCDILGILKGHGYTIFGLYNLVIGDRGLGWADAIFAKR